MIPTAISGRPISIEIKLAAAIGIKNPSERMPIASARRGNIVESTREQANNATIPPSSNIKGIR